MFASEYSIGRSDEDIHMCEEFEIQNERKNKVKLFAIFDGHGGSRVIKCINHAFIGELKKMLSTIDFQKCDSMDLQKNFIDFYKKFDFNMRDYVKDSSSGATSVMVLIIDRSHVIVCHVGDSRAIFFNKDGKIFFETKDHKPDDENEAKRVKDKGGFIAFRRVNGFLAITRALGDYYGKYNFSGIKGEYDFFGSFNTNQKVEYDPDGIVSAVPDVKIISPVPEDLNILMGSDGIFDYISSEDHVKMIVKNGINSSNLTHICSQIIEESKKQSDDDLTVILYS